MARSMLEASIARKLSGDTALPASGSAGSVSAAVRPRKVRCYHCGNQFDISPHARTGPCSKCYKRLCLDDLVVRPTSAPLLPEETLTTCGMVVVEAQVRCALARINAMDGVEVGGRLSASINSRGPVVVDAAGRFDGQVDAPSVVIRSGAVASVFLRTGRFAACQQPAAATPAPLE